MSHFHNCLEETIETSKRECGFFLVYAVSYLLGVKSQGEVILLAFTLLLEQIESSGSPNLCRLQCLWQTLFSMARHLIYYLLIRARAPLNLMYVCVCVHVIPVSLCFQSWHLNVQCDIV